MCAHIVHFKVQAVQQFADISCKVSTLFIANKDVVNTPGLWLKLSMPCLYSPTYSALTSHNFLAA